MSEQCEGACSVRGYVNERFGRALWIALLANAGMFVVEVVASWRAESTALLADAIDFLGDTANYGVSLAVLVASTRWRSRVALAKGVTMGLYGICVLGIAAWNVYRGASPEPMTMVLIALLALTVNLSVAVLLYSFRTGDANMRSVWLCSRNDAIGNIAVMLAAAGVFGTGTLWPDIGVAALFAALSIAAARTVITHARRELATTERPDRCTA
jgi:Co/Zn/Cd efflux system component